jgi:sarcosine oxidase subunit beta
MAKRTFICRCEDVTVGELEHAMELGLDRVEELKRYTGLGTGVCQGRECMAPLAKFLHERGITPGGLLQPFTPRPPLEPVSFGALASIPDEFCVEAQVAVHDAGQTNAASDMHDEDPS